MKINFFTIIIALILFSCNNAVESKLTAEKENRKQQAIDSFIQEYDIKYNLDTLFSSFLYSIELQEKFCGNPVMVNDFYIDDIYKQDDEYYAVFELWYSDIYVELNITKEQCEIFKKIGKSFNESDIIVVLILNNIRKMKFQINAYGDEEYSYAVIETSIDFIARGSIIDMKVIDVKQ